MMAFSISTVQKGRCARQSPSIDAPGEVGGDTSHRLMNDSPTKYANYHETDREAVYENATSGTSTSSFAVQYSSFDATEAVSKVPIIIEVSSARHNNLALKER